ncbi:translation initiation factor IF-3, C-terminal domain-domain-containing protein [Absidia repens]|uniref:Translation initiation factor IF-3, C-terminal domain-domain-containing protein n=1 Tax=Absidia repens TaxID=90262 RepID=A0A1X2I9C6_9FUNG|nr:translation initiation factor IF-3, C-terminal domain-domain-containing protein [Absidia repens]
MQRSALQTLCGYSRLGLARRTPMTSVCEYSTAHLFRPSPSKLMSNKNKSQVPDASRLEAVKQILRDSVGSTTSSNTRIRSSLSSPSSTKGKVSSMSQASSTAAAAADKSGRSRRDEEITSRWITFVDEQGQMHPERKRLDSVLQSFDRSLYFLVEVDPTSRPPVCRLLEKKHLFDKHKANKKKKTVSSDQVTKEIVFGWNVSPHDMGHKLGKAVQFLDKGNKVKVDVVYKRGQKRVDKETQQEVIAQVKQQLDIYKLAKPPTFSGSNCSMVFEQKKSG